LEDRLSIPAGILVLIGFILSVMIVSGCTAATESVGPQGPLGPEGAVVPQGKVGLEEAVGPQTSPGPHETTRSQGPVSLTDPVGQQGQFGVADPVVFLARMLELAGLATKVG